MSDLITLLTWLKNNNYYIIILIVPISFTLCYKVKRYLKSYPNNNLLVSNTPDNNLSTKLIFKKSDQPNDSTVIETIEDLDEEPPCYNEVI